MSAPFRRKPRWALLAPIAVASLLVGGASCASTGKTCGDLGGVCHPYGSCPAGTQPPTSAQVQANYDSEAYACPSGSASDGGGSVVCCLPVPATD